MRRNETHGGYGTSVDAQVRFYSSTLREERRDMFERVPRLWVGDVVRDVTGWGSMPVHFESGDCSPR